jgi:hypothetical protein
MKIFIALTLINLLSLAGVFVLKINETNYDKAEIDEALRKTFQI